MLLRSPHVAGSFYPSDPSELLNFCRSQIVPEIRVPARAVILPHAGYVYSGPTACRVLSRVEVPGTAVLIGPNHWSTGADFAICNAGEWETPLGRMPVDEPLAASCLKASPFLQSDPAAHSAEHSLEVLVPLLQYSNPAFRAVPLIVGTLDLRKAREVALGLAEVLADVPDALLVVSNDMSHYETDAVTRSKDRYALEAIGNLDDEALARAVRDYRITMCGFVPVYMLLVMARRIGIRAARLVDYTTSADATGDFDRVVGYAGFLFE